MTFTWDELIDRARVYVDDDHSEDEGWIDPAKWLAFANVEYMKLYVKWVRMGLIRPAATTATTTGSTLSLTRPLAVIGVGENLGSSTPSRLLEASEPRWDSLTGKSSEWSATGIGDTVTVTLYPADSGATYECKYIQYPAYATDSTASVDLPLHGDERLVLGMARRSLIKESAASRRLDEEIRDADADINMMSWSRQNGPKMRNVRARTELYPAEPGRWVYFG